MIVFAEFTIQHVNIDLYFYFSAYVRCSQLYTPYKAYKVVQLTSPLVQPRTQQLEINKSLKMAEKINRDSLSLCSSIHASTESTSTAENDDGTESAMSEYDIDEEYENEEVGRDDQRVSNEEISSNEDHEMEEDDEDGISIS